MKLHEAVKQILNHSGEAIICEVRLANLVADLNGYEEYPAMKKVFRDTLKAGYGNKIYELYTSNSNSINVESAKYVEEYAKESNYKSEYIRYSIDTLLFGLGIIDTINEPLSKGFNPLSNGNMDLLDNLDGQLESLKKQYLDLLDRLPILPADLLHDAPGYYSTESLNVLHGVEYKIIAIGQQLGETYSNWCEDKLTSKLEDFKKQKYQHVEPLLTELKKKYCDTLEALLIKPKRCTIKLSGYLTEESDNQLSEIEREIKTVYYNLGKPYDDWCENQKNDYLSSAAISKDAIFLQIFVKLCVPLVIILGSIGFGLSYLTSMDEIKKFNSMIDAGEQKTLQGYYGTGIQMFSDAGNNYKGSFLVFAYKKLANNHINKNFEIATDKCVELINEKKLLSAHTLLKSLPQNIINEDAQRKGKIEEIDSLLDIAKEKELDALIQKIYQNTGNLDNESKNNLGELLEAFPEDYWLNFIKNKEQ